MCAQSPPASWKMFADVNEYVAFMNNPDRVVRLEWRKARRPQLRGMTSHSWLLAHTLRGVRLRFEIFQDIGFLETVLALGEPDRDSTLYEDRVAGPHDFSRPLTSERLRSVAASAAATEYNLTEFNCHHFALEVWNSVVIEMMQQTHYPDRVKTGLLGAVGEFFENVTKESEEGWSLWNQLGAQLGSLGSAASASSGPRVELPVDFECQGRSSGQVQLPARPRPATLPKLLLLEPGSAPVWTDERQPDAWAQRWVRDVSSSATERLLQRLGPEDLGELWLALEGSEGPEASDCFVVLKGQELRVCAFSVRGSRRLRLLSGDCCQSDCCQGAAFTLRSGTGTATEAMQDELEGLQMALVTGEWAFLTLQ